MQALRELQWSAAEKNIARRAHEEALACALAKLLAEFKAKAAAASAPSDMWDIEDYLREQRLKIDDLFDYRYSRLPLVFARLIQEGHLDEGRLSGLGEEKLATIRHFASL